MNHMNLKMFFVNLWSVAKKELRGYIDNPTAYIVLVVFLLLVEFLFFKQAFLIGEASLRSLAALLPWLFLLLIPAMSMGSVAEEKDKGTVEIVLTKPIREVEFLAGKFFASIIFVAAGMLFIFPIAWGLSRHGNLDWGAVFGQYFASVTLGSVLMSLGIAVSGVFRSQISAFLVSAVLSLLLLIFGFDLFSASVPRSLAVVFERLSALTHYSSMARGVIDLRDVWYAISFITVALSFAYMRLIKIKYGNQARIYRKYKTGSILIMVIAVLTNIVGSRVPGRIDLTQDRLFTLTDATKDILGNLDDLVTINLYASKGLPAQFQPILRDTTDLLRDYERFSGGNVRVEIKDPSSDSDIVSELSSYGIQTVRFNVVEQEGFQVKQGYLGLAVNYADKSESIPFIQDTSDLEYQLTSFIRKLTNKEKKKIIFIQGHGEKSVFADYGVLQDELKKQFNVDTLSLSSSTPSIDTDTSVLVVAGPTDDFDEASLLSLRQAVANGISAAFFLDGVNVNPGYGQVVMNTSNVLQFIKDEFGIMVNNDLVYDLKSNETVNTGNGGFFQILLPYPLWIRVLSADNPHPITAKIHSMVLPWPSSITFNKDDVNKNGWEAAAIFSSSRFGGVQSSGSFNIQIDQKFPKTNLNQYHIAAALSPRTESAARGRIVIVSDSDFLTDQFARQSSENIGFGIEALSWLAQENSLAGIQLKQRQNRSLLFAKPSQPKFIKYGNLLLAVLLPAGLGLWRFMKRRSLRSKKYN